MTILIKTRPNNFKTADGRYIVTKTRDMKGYTLVDTLAKIGTPERFPFGGGKTIEEIKTFIKK